jgi:hypothetical protein
LNEAMRLPAGREAAGPFSLATGHCYCRERAKSFRKWVG